MLIRHRHLRICVVQLYLFVQVLVGKSGGICLGTFNCFPTPAHTYVACVVWPIVPSRGRFHADVAGILRGTLRGKSRNEAVASMDFNALYCRSLRLDTSISVIRGPSHACGKTGASLP